MNWKSRTQEKNPGKRNKENRENVRKNKIE